MVRKWRKIATFFNFYFRTFCIYWETNKNLPRRASFEILVAGSGFGFAPTAQINRWLNGILPSAFCWLWTTLPQWFKSSNRYKTKNAPQGYVFSFNWLRGVDLATLARSRCSPPYFRLALAGGWTTLFVVQIQHNTHI